VVNRQRRNPQLFVERPVLTVNYGANITITGDASGTNRRVAVTGDATVTLDSLKIDMTHNPGNSNSGAIAATNCAFAVTNNATVNLTLASGNKATGLNIPSGSKVTVSGAGSLTASCTDWGGAGIGGNRQETTGEITILSGTVIANGSSWAAGIGGGWERPGGTITIIGGTIIANGGDCRKWK
jgi:hypothetical protein